MTSSGTGGQGDTHLNLKVSGAIFPIKKDRLFKKLGIFHDDSSRLSSSEYEVRTQVPLPVFASFVEVLDGADVVLSEDNCEGFRRLSMSHCLKMRGTFSEGRKNIPPSS
jgi:hypothetical protein